MLRLHKLQNLIESPHNRAEDFRIRFVSYLVICDILLYFCESSNPPTPVDSKGERVRAERLPGFQKTRYFIAVVFDGPWCRKISTNPPTPADSNGERVREERLQIPKWRPGWLQDGLMGSKKRKRLGKALFFLGDVWHFSRFDGFVEVVSSFSKISEVTFDTFPVSTGL